MMKNIKWLFMLLWVIGGALASCSDDKSGTDPDDGGKPQIPALEVDKTELLFQRDEATAQLIITSNVKWTATSSVSWCSLSKMSGNGNDTIQIAIAENPTTGRRNGEVFINAGGDLKKKIPVVQLGTDVETLVFVDGVEITSGKAELDFEQGIYMMVVMSNVNLEYDLLKSEPWFQYRVTNPDPKGRVFSLNLDDNRKEDGGQQRQVAFKFTEEDGAHSDTVYIVQKPYNDFVRFSMDTVYAGSHFSCLEILARTTVGWNYEFVGGMPDWVSNPTVENPFKPTVLGKRSRLMLDLKTNDKYERRGCQVKFTYRIGGKEETQTVNVIQLPNDATASDSLVLMKLAEKNAVPSVGLSVDNWVLELPFVQWGNGTDLVFEEVNGKKRVSVLKLRSAYMCYELTPDIANLSELRVLALDKNYLYGSLPKEMGRLKKLEELSVSENYASDTDDSPTGLASGLEEFPREIGVGCTNLKKLTLAMNRFTSIPEGITELKNLEMLDMAMNSLLKNVDNDRMKSCKSLKEIDISRIAYNGPFLDFIFDCSQLEQVSFNGISFANGTVIKDEFAQLPALRVLGMGGCNLSGPLPLSLISCKNLETISLYENHLEGPLLAEYAQLDRLSTVTLYGNDLTGSIPESWVRIGNVGFRIKEAVSNVFLNDNRLSGVIPEAIKNMPAWSDTAVHSVVEWDTKTKMTGYWAPTQFTCPQQAGYGFTNCDVKK